MTLRAGGEEEGRSCSPPPTRGDEGAKEVPGSLLSAQTSFRVHHVPVPDGCGQAHRLKAGSPTSSTCSTAASPSPALLIPAPRAHSAQQRREDREREQSRAASQLGNLGTESAPRLEQAPGGGGGQFSWQRIRSHATGKAGKSLQEGASPGTHWDWAQGEPSYPRAHKWHH